MVARKSTDDQIIAAYEAHGRSPTRAAASLGITVRNFHERMGDIEAKTGEKLRLDKGSRVVISRNTRPNPITIDDGVMVVGSDAHYWPGEVSTGHRAMVRMCKMLRPEFVVLNGDEFDGATISRHSRIGWQKSPTVQQEVQELQDRTGDFEKVAPRAKFLGSYGNHTIRFDTYLSGAAPQMEGVKGMRFDDLLPRWNYAWAWMVNNHTLIKHRIRGGVHASWNNTMSAGVSTVTGHTHQLEVKPRTLMTGTLYGVDTGTLADPWGPQFEYLEAGPRNWRSGCVVLTFRGGELLPPEICHVIGDGKAWFRGEVLDV